MDSAATATEIDRRDRLAGTLLGTALGDALGLPAEGMSARAIARRFGRVDRFRLLGPVGFVSDDTEQTALVAEALVVAPGDPDRAAEHFRRELLRWFARLPWGVGRATIRACLRIALRRPITGVRSAGNGAAMRSAIIGTFLAGTTGDNRRNFSKRLAEVTHTDQRALEGAVFVAEVAAYASIRSADTERNKLVARGYSRAEPGELKEAVGRAIGLALLGRTAEEAGAESGRSGYVVHTVGLATFLFLRFGDDPMTAWAEGISVGGDTDSVAAIVGAWMGARHGESGLPGDLIARLHDGPYGPTHLRRLADALVRAHEGVEISSPPPRGIPQPAPRYSRVGAMARNLALMPVILGHGFRRLIPF